MEKRKIVLSERWRNIFILLKWVLILEFSQKGREIFPESKIDQLAKDKNYFFAIIWMIFDVDMDSLFRCSNLKDLASLLAVDAKSIIITNHPITESKERDKELMDALDYFFSKPVFQKTETKKAA